jgi:hypothetical protein
MKERKHMTIKVERGEKRIKKRKLLYDHKSRGESRK